MIEETINYPLPIVIIKVCLSFAMEIILDTRSLILDSRCPTRPRQNARRAGKRHCREGKWQAGVASLSGTHLFFPYALEKCPVGSE